MKLDIKNYKITRTNKYFKINKLFFFVNGASQNSLNWLLTEQGLKKLGFDYYKVLNKTTALSLKNSIYKNTKTIISGCTFLIKPSKTKHFSKQAVLSNLNPLFFELLLIKFNNKTYPLTSLDTIYSLKYKETKLLFYQFRLSFLKTSITISK